MLRERHEGRIVTCSFRDGDASQARVFLDLAEAGLEFELVYGGINDIRGRATSRWRSGARMPRSTPRFARSRGTRT